MLSQAIWKQTHTPVPIIYTKAMRGRGDRNMIRDANLLRELPQRGTWFTFALQCLPPTLDSRVYIENCRWGGRCKSLTHSLTHSLSLLHTHATAAEDAVTHSLTHDLRVYCAQRTVAEDVIHVHALCWKWRYVTHLVTITKPTSLPAEVRGSASFNFTWKICLHVICDEITWRLTESKHIDALVGCSEWEMHVMF